MSTTKKLKFYKMKKLLLGLFALLNISCFAQEADLPNSVSVLGRKYIDEYAQVLKTVQEVNIAISSNETQFPDVKTLLDFSNGIWIKNSSNNIKEVQNNSAIVKNFEHMAATKNYSPENILHNNLDKKTYEILVSISKGIASIPENVSLDQYLYNYSIKLNNSEFTDLQKDVIAKYIIGFNAATKGIEDIFTKKYPENVQLQGKNACCDWLKKIIKCAAGTVGGALTGALGGAAVGSAVPMIGTAAGAAAGLIGGGLTGAVAAGCWD
jgi:hypothetical protein